MIPVVCAVIHNFIRINNPNDWLLRRYNLDGHTVHKVDPQARRLHDDGDDNIPDGLVTPNLVVGQESMSRVRDNMTSQM